MLSLITSYHCYTGVFCFFPLSAASKNLSQLDAVLLRLTDHFTEKTTVCISEIYKKGNVSSHCLCLTTPPDVSAVRNKNMFLLLFSLFRVVFQSRFPHVYVLFFFFKDK